jgi:hypothetical protein
MLPIISGLHKADKMHWSQGIGSMAGEEVIKFLFTDILKYLVYFINKILIIIFNTLTLFYNRTDCSLC